MPLKWLGCRQVQQKMNELVPFAPPKIDYIVDEPFTRGIFSDGAAHLVDCFKGDVVDPNLKSQFNTYRLPALVKRILVPMNCPGSQRALRSGLRHAEGALEKDLPKTSGISMEQRRAGSGFPGALSQSSLSLLHEASIAASHSMDKQDGLTNRRAAEKLLKICLVTELVYRTEFIAKWREPRLDVILCPALGPAFNHGYAGKLFAVTSYTDLYNVLNFPAGVVLVSTVTRADEEELKHYQGHYGDPWDKRLKEAVAGAVGLPVAVQCAALPRQEEMCLCLIKEVETLAHSRKRNV